MVNIMKPETVLEVAGVLAKQLFPAISPAVSAVELLVRYSMGGEHSITAEGVQKREQAAGASANKASHLAGLDGHIMLALYAMNVTQDQAERACRAIMAEVARRMP
jgi:hypothetical protein